MENDFNYKWSKLFASKRYNTKDGVIKLTPEEQQELLDDSERVVKNCSKDDVNPTEHEFKAALRLLNDLANCQNGAPLEQHRKEWEEVMERTYEFINAHED